MSFMRSVVSGFLAFSLSGGIPAQIGGGTECLPSACGQWNGPYVLNIPSSWEEITHAGVLPPRWGAPPTGFEGKVLFVAQPNPVCNLGSNPAYFTTTWLWDAANPTVARAVPVPNKDEHELWCGCHAFSPDGDWLWIGGTNTTSLLMCFTGSRGVYRWDSAASAWMAMNPLDGSGPRWYGTPLELASGAVLIDGDLAASFILPAPPVSPRETHQVLTGMTLGPLLPNAKVNGTTCTPIGGNAELLGYAWMHQVKSGAAFRTGQEKDTKYFTMICPDLVNPGQFLSDRWVPAGANSNEHRFDGNSIHFLTFEVPPGSPPGTPPVRKETIFLVAGQSAISGNNGCTSATLNSIEKIVNPAPGVGWQTINPPVGFQMQFGRRHANTVILPDGTLLVVGGLTWDTSLPIPSCQPAYSPELYDPFDGPDGKWFKMNAQLHRRGYHSVAFLLLDGRVVSAGGQMPVMPGTAEPEEHSVEIFSPPYLFNGPRPAISDAPASVNYLTSGGPSTFSFGVRAGIAGDGPAMVSLVRPSSVTHGVDFNQRFVQLFIESISITSSPPPPTEYAVEVRKPEDANISLFRVSCG